MRHSIRAGAIPQSRDYQAEREQANGLVEPCHQHSQDADFAGAKGPAGILYDQLNNPGTSSTSSQDFDAANAAFDDFAADDFVVPGGQTWNITEVDAQGGYSAGSALSFNVFFYQDTGGVPATNPFYAAIGQSYVNNSGVFLITLTLPAVLTSGTYWVSVQARMDLDNGQWFWTDRTVQANSPAVWQNPGGGFGVCPTWALRTTCVGDESAPDQMFRLIGTLTGSLGASRYDFNGDGYPDYVIYNSLHSNRYCVPQRHRRCRRCLWATATPRLALDRRS